MLTCAGKVRDTNADLDIGQMTPQNNLIKESKGVKGYINKLFIYQHKTEEKENLILELKVDDIKKRLYTRKSTILFIKHPVTSFQEKRHKLKYLQNMLCTS